MKAKKILLTAATLSAFLAFGGFIQAQNTGGDKARIGKKPTKVRTYRSGKKGHRHRKGHKGGKKSKKGSGGSTTPPPK